MNSCIIRESRKIYFVYFFFRIIFVDELTRKIQKASSFSNRTVNLNHRVEYKKNIEIQNIRKEVLVKTDDKFLKKIFLIKYIDFAEITNILLLKE